MGLFQLTRQYSITDEENVVITRITQLRRYTYSIVKANSDFALSIHGNIRHLRDDYYRYDFNVRRIMQVSNSYLRV